MILPLSLLLLLLVAAPDEGPRREFVLVNEAKHLTVVREVQEDDRLGFNRHCLVQLRYPENKPKSTQCFPADEAASALARSRDLELFVALRDSQLAQALAALPDKGFVPPAAFGEQVEAGLQFDWGGRRATLRLGADKKNRPALLLAVKGQPQAKTLLTLEDLPPTNTTRRWPSWIGWACTRCCCWRVRCWR